MRTPIAALLLLPSLALAVACSSEEGTTPNCKSNVTDAGIQPDPDSGCEQFPVCYDAAGNVDPKATACCGAQSPTMIDCSIVRCRLGYGVPTSELTDAERTMCLTTTSSGTTTTTSSGGGAGGGAGGGGGSN